MRRIQREHSLVFIYPFVDFISLSAVEGGTCLFLVQQHWCKFLVCENLPGHNPVSDSRSDQVHRDTESLDQILLLSLEHINMGRFVWLKRLSLEIIMPEDKKTLNIKKMWGSRGDTQGHCGLLHLINGSVVTDTKNASKNAFCVDQLHFTQQLELWH